MVIIVQTLLKFSNDIVTFTFLIKFKKFVKNEKKKPV